MNSQNPKIKKPKKKVSMLNKFLSMLILVSLVMTSLFVTENIFATAPDSGVANILKPGTKITVKSDGKDLSDAEENTDIDGKKDISINVEIDVPVISDDPKPTSYVNHGDKASIKLAEGFLYDETKNKQAQEMKFTDENGEEKKVGDAHFEEHDGSIYLMLDFNGDEVVFTGWHKVKVKIYGDFSLNLTDFEPNQGGEKERNHT